LELRSVDISHNYLNGILEEEIYMQQPEGFEVGGPEYVCRLIKLLYGLKQAGRVWNRTLHAVLTSMGFSCIQSDHGLYTLLRDDIKVFMTVFVNDIMFAGSDGALIDSIVKDPSQHFKLHDLGPTTHDCKPVSTPLNPGSCLSTSMSPQNAAGASEMHQVPYISVVGSLMYLAVITTRPDIAYAAGVLARFNSIPGPSHWQAAKHVSHYLQGTMGYRIP